MCTSIQYRGENQAIFCWNKRHKKTLSSQGLLISLRCKRAPGYCHLMQIKSRKAVQKTKANVPFIINIYFTMYICTNNNFRTENIFEHWNFCFHAVFYPFFRPFFWQEIFLCGFSTKKRPPLPDSYSEGVANINSNSPR